MEPIKDELNRRLENRVKRLEIALAFSLIGLGIMTLAIIVPDLMSPSRAQTSVTDALRVRELVIVDRNGTERVRIGSELPDAVIDGKRVNRGEKVSGIMLYDASGQERGGYVAFEPSGNIALTLDSKKQQTALFVSGPDEGSALQLWHQNDLIEFRSDSDGTRMTTVKNGQIVSQQPGIDKMSPSSCSEYRDAAARVSAEVLNRECRRRFLGKTCDACLTQNRR